MRSLFRIKTVDEVITSPTAGATYVGVTINWYCESRLTPVIPYDLAIPEWDSLVGAARVSDRQISYFNGAAAFIDQFFTEEEVEAVRDYLARRQSPRTVIEEVELPLPRLDLPYSALRDDPRTDADFGFVNMPTDSAWPFRFTVRGCFDQVYRTVAQRYRDTVVHRLAARCASLGTSTEGVCHASSVMTEGDLARLLATLLKSKGALSDVTDGHCDPPAQQAA